MTVFEIEEDGVDCVDEEFDEASREWEDDEDNGEDLIPELYFCNPDPYAKRKKGSSWIKQRSIPLSSTGSL